MTNLDVLMLPSKERMLPEIKGYNIFRVVKIETFLDFSVAKRHITFNVARFYTTMLPKCKKSST